MCPNQKTYAVNDIFYSPQGEGVRTGTMNLFLRFAGCDMACDMAPSPRSPGGFACDTEFVSQVGLTAAAILERFHALSPACRWAICTGGEPALQLDTPLVDTLHAAGYSLALETNGGTNIDHLGLDWVTVSPKVAEHAIQQRTAHEAKYVRAYGQGIPKTVIAADHYLISPAFQGDHLDPKTLAWCLQLCKDHPQWRLSCQLHKWWNVR
jgi:7-carboxy-7-deazaguanine synthase